MDVGVDESRHQGCRAQIDHRGAGRMRDRGASFNNAIAAYQHLTGAREPALLHIEDVGCVEHDDVVRRTGGGGDGRLGVESRGGGKHQNEDESGSGAQGQARE